MIDLLQWSWLSDVIIVATMMIGDIVGGTIKIHGIVWHAVICHHNGPRKNDTPNRTMILLISILFLNMNIGFGYIWSIKNVFASSLIQRDIIAIFLCFISSPSSHTACKKNWNFLKSIVYLWLFFFLILSY